MPERKSHVKSRHGCSQCKARRVKCDETRPTCGNCQRRQEHCSYQHVRQAESPPSPHSPAGLGQAKNIFAAVHLRELELMHQWSTSTCFTLAMRSTGTIRHQIEIPRLALEHECLLDTVFALTSLHLASLRPESARSYIVDALRYQARAVTSTRQKLVSLAGPKCEALYHASSQLGAIALAFRSVDTEHAKASKPTETLSQLAQLWRGTATILEASRGLVDPAAISMYMPQVDWAQRTHSTLTGQMQVFFHRLRERAKAGYFGMSDSDPASTDEEAVRTYIETLDHLQAIFNAEDLEVTRILAWIVLIPPPFMEYLSQGQQLAKAILLLYSLAMTQLDNQWWTRNFRQHLVDELAADVAACDSELAEIADYVRAWTESTNGESFTVPSHDTGIHEVTQWVQSHTIEDHSVYAGPQILANHYLPRPS